MHLLGGFGIEIVVDEKHGGKRHAVGGKHGNALLDGIFEDAKFVLAEIGGQRAGGGFDANRNDHEIGPGANGRLRIGGGLRGRLRPRRDELSGQGERYTKRQEKAANVSACRRHRSPVHVTGGRGALPRISPRLARILSGDGAERAQGDYTMRMKWVGVILLGTALGAAPCFVPRIAARAPRGQQAQPQDSIKIQVSLVNLFATVRDKKTKRIVSTLEQSNFKIVEDNTEQKIAFFSRESTLPITLGILLDTSGSEQFMLPAEQDAATRFLGTVLRKNDLAMVMSFDSDADLLADFTDDRDILNRAIHRARINAPAAQGPLAGNLAGTILYDGIYLACNEKLASEAGRKALVILTDAEDTGSKDSLQDAIEAAQRTDTVVHILLVGDPRNFSVNDGVAKKLTEETGGRTIVVQQREEFGRGFPSDQRRTAQPVHAGLLLDQRSARRVLSQGEGGNHAEGS